MGAQKQAAGSMDTAVSGLERRLAAGGGSDGDWELLAKSYEFLGRPADAAAARQKHLPAGADSAGAAAAATSRASGGAAVGGGGQAGAGRGGRACQAGFRRRSRHLRQARRAQ